MSIVLQKNLTEDGILHSKKPITATQMRSHHLRIRMNQMLSNTSIIIILCAIAIGVGILYAIPHTRKYVRYAWILIPAVAVLFLVLFIKKERDKSKDDQLRDAIDNIKGKFEEVNMRTAIEITAAREKNKGKLKELKEVTRIKDSKERRQRLINLME